MKKAGNLWSSLASVENIKQAHAKARKGKLHYKEVQKYDKDVDKYSSEISKLLLDKSFKTSPYLIQELFDGRKNRTVYKLPYFPDRVVHHALMLVVGPLIQKSLIRDTFQSLPNRGTSDAARRVKRLIVEKKPKYAVKLDIEKYYPSVNNEVLKEKLANKIKCKDTLWLLNEIIDSSKGLPIGNYTSQILGNFYLSSLDWKVKQEIKPLGYFRYCDDLVLFSNSKKFLKETFEKLSIETTLLDLKIKPNYQIVNVDKQGIDFVGYVFKSKSTRLRKTIKDSFTASSKGLPALNSLMAYKGWVKHSNSKKLWRKHTEHLITTYRKQLTRKI